jgi:hypothetical protein
MYVYMLKVLHNEWNIDLILRLQKCNAVKKHIILHDIQNITNIMQWKPVFYVGVSHIMLILKLNRFTKW